MKKARHGDATQGKNQLEGSPSHLLHRVLQIAIDIYGSEVGEGALTQRQYALLRALDGSEGLSQTELVHATGIDRSTLADLVARMLAKKLLMRERSSLDARANLVRLADAGRAALNEMQPKVAAADEKILSLLSPPKRDSFVKLLRKITLAREEELAVALGAETVARKEKAGQKAIEKAAKKPEKKKKSPKKAKHAKKLKNLPMPALTQGANIEPAEAPAVERVANEA